MTITQQVIQSEEELNELELKALKLVTVHHLDMSFYPILWSARMIRENLEISHYKAQKTMRSLKDKGYIKKISYTYPCGCYEYHECEQLPPAHGNIATDKAKKLFAKEIKEQEEYEIALIEKHLTPTKTDKQTEVEKL